MQTTASYIDWHLARQRADSHRQQWERVARYRKDPLRYMDGRRSIGAPAVEPWVPDGPAPDWVPPAPVAVEPPLLRNDPLPADLTEMRLEQSMQSIVEAWEAYQRNRDAFIARFNIEAQHHRMGCKLIRCKAYQ